MLYYLFVEKFGHTESLEGLLNYFIRFFRTTNFFRFNNNHRNLHDMSVFDSPLADDLIEQAVPALLQTNDDFSQSGVPRNTEDSNINPVDLQLRKIVSVMMQSLNMSCSQDFLDQLTDLSIEYLNDTIQSLRKFTELQRRRNPSLGDTKQFLRTKGVNPTIFVDEIERSKQLAPQLRQKVTQIQSSTKSILHQMNTPNEQFDPLDESLPFFTNEVYQIASLVPKFTVKPDYIPAYLPDLPPDFTYQNTAKYMDRLTDLKELRLKLVEESRLTEKSLYSLIEDDEKKWRSNFEAELNSFEQEQEKKAITSENDKEDDLTTVTTAPTIEKKDAKQFDFIEYSRKRTQLLKRREEREVKKAKLRENNLFMNAERYFSPYGTISVTSEVTQNFKKIMQDEFKSVIKSVREAEKSKARRIEETLRERARKERMKQDGTESFGFDFGQILHSDEDSDENEEFPVFDFPDEPAAQAPQMDIDANPNININNEGQNTAENHWELPNPNNDSEDDLEAELENVMEEEITHSKDSGISANGEISNMNIDQNAFNADDESDEDDFENL